MPIALALDWHQIDQQRRPSPCAAAAAAFTSFFVASILTGNKGERLYLVQDIECFTQTPGQTKHLFRINN